MSTQGKPVPAIQRLQAVELAKRVGYRQAHRQTGYATSAIEKWSKLLKETGSATQMTRYDTNMPKKENNFSTRSRECQ